MNKEPLDILLIDSHAELLGDLIERTLALAGMDVHMTARNSQKEGLEAVTPVGEQIVFCAVGYSGSWAVYKPKEIISEVKKRNPDAEVIIYTGGVYTPQEARDDGAAGYFYKTDKPSKLVDVLAAVRDGTFWD